MTRCTARFRRRFWRLSQALVAAATLGLIGCGGGFFIELGSFDDTPPSVSLAAAQTTVQAGQTLRVVAAAADANGIDFVAFYRLDGNAAVLLGSDGREPYEWSVVAPTDGRNQLSLFARATDNFGNRADSLVIDVTVTH
jgi:Bacterial Ig domain